MEPARVAYWAVAATILGSLVLAGPVGGLDVTSESSDLGGGTATVADVELGQATTLEAGRFGTDRAYARGPVATVTVHSVTGTPRLVLRTEIPALEYEGVATELLEPDTNGRHRLSIPDEPFSPAAVAVDTATVRTTVRVQSFDGNWLVFERNRTVGVAG